MDIIVGLIFWKAVEDMLEFEEYKVKLNNMKPTLDGLGSALKLDDARSEIAELEAESAKEGFWNDLDRSQKVQKRMKQLQQKCEKYEKLQSTWEDLMTICEMALEENDDSMLGELETDYAKLESELEAMRLSTLLSGEYDANNVILSIHPGAGGTEAQDWAQMLQRMYLRWADSHGFSVEELDFLPGDEAGIKSVSLRISGENVYGFLKGERGIHRLIRISPFDSSGRRHTSFASVDVIPDAGDDIEIEIKESDLRVDIFCASGPGGQGVNTTYSAVRITHIPSGISVQCQNERSQHHNKDSAMRILRGRLYDLELSKRDAARQAEYAGKNAISFGSQIRTYTLQPYRLVKDHRNNCEIGDTDAVLDGRIDKLLRDYLLWQHTNRQQQQQ